MFLNNCGGCHSVATTLLSRKTADGWTSFLHDQRAAYVPAMTDAELKTLTDYLIANFNPDVPDFNIPPQLLAGEVITPY